MVEMTEFSVDSEGVELYCKRIRPADAPPGAVSGVLLVHGGLVDSDFFDGCARELAERFDVVAYDRRGYGRSGDPLSCDYSLETQAEDARKVMQACFDGPCSLIAHSVGCSVAMTLVSRHAECVNCALYYEPPVPSCLPGDSRLVGAVAKTCEKTYAGRRIGTIGDGFLFGMAPKDDRVYCPTEAEQRRSARNTACSITNEGDVLMLFAPDAARLAAVPSAIGLGELDRNAPVGTMVKALAEFTAMLVLAFPGGHNCPADLPREFACMSAGFVLAYGGTKSGCV